MINDALRLLRLYVGLTQKQVAIELELSQSIISEIENGSKSVSMEMLEKYSDKFEIRMSKLLFLQKNSRTSQLRRVGSLL